MEQSLWKRRLCFYFVKSYRRSICTFFEKKYQKPGNRSEWFPQTLRVGVKGKNPPLRIPSRRFGANAVAVTAILLSVI